MTTEDTASEATEPVTGEDVEQVEDTAQESNAESDVEYWKRRARENEERSKANHQELEKLRRDAMSEQDRAIAQARDEARAETVRELSGRLVDAEVRSNALNRPLNVDALLDGLDRSRFLDEAGEVDRDAVSTWLDQLAPVQAEPRSASDLGQGTRSVNRSDPADVFGQLITGKIT